MDSTLYLTIDDFLLILDKSLNDAKTGWAELKKEQATRAAISPSAVNNPVYIDKVQKLYYDIEVLNSRTLALLSAFKGTYIKGPEVEENVSD